MAKIAVELIADTVAYTKGLTKAAAQTKEFGATIDSTSKHIGRSLAFATGGFVAFAGATDVLKTSIDAARDAGVSQKQLAAQMKASGQSFAANKAAIDQAELSLEKYGFTSEDSAKALTVLERGSGNITRAINLQGVSADLARAKNISLAAAANVVAKVFSGQTSALRRAVPGLAKHAEGLQLIAEAQKRLAGQAAAGTTEAEKFAATLHNTEVIIGNALLPTVDKLLTQLGAWLDEMNRSGQLQKDVNEAVQTGTGLFQAALAIVKPLAAAFKVLGDAVGGTKNEVMLLVGAFATFKAASLLNSLAGVGTAVAGIGTKAAAASGEVEALSGSLSGLAAPLAAIPVAMALANRFDAKGPAGGQFANIAQLNAAIAAGGDSTGLLKKLRSNLRAAAASGDPSAKAFLAGTSAAAAAGGGAAGGANTFGGMFGRNIFAPNAFTPGWTPNLPNLTAPALSGSQQLAVALARDPNNIGLLQQKASADRAAITFAQSQFQKGRISSTQLTAILKNYYGDLTSTLGTITSIQQAAAAAAKTQADAAKAAAAKQKAAAKARAAAAREMIARLLGRQRESPEQYVAAAERPGSFERLVPLIATGYTTPGLLQLQAAKATLTKSSKDDVVAAKRIRAAAEKALKSGKLNWEAQIEAINVITGVNTQLKDAATGATDTYKQQRNRAVRLARSQGAEYQFAYANAGPTVHIEHFYSSAANPRALENELVKRAKARPHVRRGAR